MMAGPRNLVWSAKPPKPSGNIRSMCPGELLDDFCGEIVGANILESIVRLPQYLSSGDWIGMAFVGKMLYGLSKPIADLNLGIGLSERIRGYPAHPQYYNWVFLTKSVMKNHVDTSKKLIDMFEKSLLNHWSDETRSFPQTGRYPVLRILGAKESCVLYMASAAFEKFLKDKETGEFGENGIGVTVWIPPR